MTLSRSLRHRLARRHVSPYVWLPVPVISPYDDKLRAAAFPDSCYAVELEPGVFARVQAPEPVSAEMAQALRRLAREVTPRAGLRSPETAEPPTAGVPGRPDLAETPTDR
jgi:hypothetical protein